ncbi:MAG TPA: deoxyribose-phosphate aldolase [Acholeplasma sp.]|nr:deoxyribose-phosphate aldolase [Acholeplasma sp.]
MNMYNSYIDHTLLSAQAKVSDIKKLCNEAKEYKFKAVCVNPCYVRLAKEQLKDFDVLVATVIGFPLGANTFEMKKAEAIDAIKNGADEIDMVVNIGMVKDQNWEYVKRDIEKVYNACKTNVLFGKKTLKVILETCYLTKEEIKKVCEIATEVGADFVKTSTGFGTGGAKVEDVKLMKESIGPNMEVKASGGIRDLATLKAMVEAGATRIGCSSSVKIMEELKGGK